VLVNILQSHLFLVALPIFLMHPEDVIVKVYTPVVFICKVSGFGNITIDWKRIGFKLPVTSSISVIKADDTFTSILRITRTSGYYAGQYYCIAHNSVGKVTSQIARLFVKGIHSIFNDCKGNYREIWIIKEVKLWWNNCCRKFFAYFDIDNYDLPKHLIVLVYTHIRKITVPMLRIYVQLLHILTWPQIHIGKAAKLRIQRSPSFCAKQN